MKIAFVASGINKTPYSEYIPLAKYFEEKGHESFFLLKKGSSKGIANSILIENLKLYFDKQVVVNQFQESEPVLLKNKHDKKSNVKGLIKLLSRARLFLRFYRSIKESLGIVQSVFKKEKPDVVVVYGDRNKELVPAAMKYCNQHDIPVCVIQIAANNMEFVLHSRLSNSDFRADNFFNKLLNRKSPAQVYIANGKAYNFFPWYLGWALHLNGVLPRNPWYDGESWASKCLLISNQHLLDAKKEGAECKNAIVTGQFSHDKLFESYRDKEKIKVNITAKYFENKENLPIIIYGLPQLVEHGLLSKKEAFQSIRNILSGIPKDSYNVLISLHPKMQYENYSWIEHEFSNVKIAREERLNNILPTGEYFISAFESTISWAIMCGVVPIYTDYYNLGLDVSKYKSCVVFKSNETFDEDFSKLNKDLLIDHIKKDQENLPPFDGKSGERILNELVDLVK